MTMHTRRRRMGWEEEDERREKRATSSVCGAVQGERKKEKCQNKKSIFIFHADAAAVVVLFPPTSNGKFVFFSLPRNFAHSIVFPLALHLAISKYSIMQERQRQQQGGEQWQQLVNGEDRRPPAEERERDPWSKITQKVQQHNGLADRTTKHSIYTIFDSSIAF